jgi:hypothetical protein
MSVFGILFYALSLSYLQELPFRFLRVPPVSLGFPRLPEIGTSGIFILSTLFYFFISSGLIYDIINLPPAMGVDQDPVTGQYRSEVFYKYRLSSQFIIEGNLSL